MEDIIIPIPNTSVIGYRYLVFNNIYPELIHVDASHDYEDVKIDIANFYGLLKDGGVLFSLIGYEEEYNSEIVECTRNSNWKNTQHPLVHQFREFYPVRKGKYGVSN